MTLDASGRLGIGIVPTPDDGKFNVSINGIGFHLGYAANFDNYYTSGSLGFHVFRSGTTERMRITSGGQVLMGTTSAQSGARLQVAGGFLDVWSSANTLLRLRHDGTRGIIETFTGGAYGVTSIAPDGGNVGIGTTNPLAKLHVAGGEIRNSFGSGQGGANYFNIIDGISNGFRTIVSTSNQITYTFHNGANGAVLNLAESGAATFSSSVTGVDIIANGSLFAGGSGESLGVIIRDVINTSIPSSSVKAIIGATNSGFGYAAGSLLIQPRTGVGAVTVFTTEGSEKMRITSGGNVGIGTTSPANLLTLKASVVAPIIDINRSGGGQGKNSGILFRDQVNNEQAAIGTEGQNTNDLQLLSTTAIRFYTSSDLVLSNERMRITSSGNVGIGTTSPSARLEINAASSSSILRVLGGGDGTGGGKGNIRSGDQGGLNFWDFGRDNLSTGDFVITQYGGSPILRLSTNTGAATFSSSVTAGNLFVSYSGSNAGIEFGNSGSGGQFGFLKWDNASNYVYLGHSYGGAFNRNLVINSSGNVGIGTTSPTTRLTVQGGYANFTDGTINIYAGSDGDGGLFGTITNHYQRFITNNVERMRITSGGDVGIGTTTPLLTASGRGNLTINGSSNSILTFGIGGVYSGYIYSSSAVLELDAQGGRSIDFNTNGNQRMRITSGGHTNIGGNYTQTADIFQTTGSNRFNTGSNKHILIKDATHDGLSSLTSAITFSRTDGISDLAALFGWNNGGIALAGREGIVFATGGGSLYSNTLEAMRITSAGNVGIGTTSPQADLHIYRTGSTPTITTGLKVNHECNADDFVVFFTGNESAATNRFVMLQGGNVGIGTTSPSSILDIVGSGNPTLTLRGSAPAYTSIINMLAAGAGSSVISATGGANTLIFATNNLDRLIISSSGAATFSNSVTATAFFASSDIRLKDIIAHDGDMITYKWKDGRDDKIHYGYSAQNLQSINPNLVNKNDDGFLSVNYTETLVLKVRELEKEVQLLKAQIN
jgi:hypothetical protein